MDIKYNLNCKYFIFDRPCKYHKQKDIICSNCTYCKKIDKRILIIKLDALGDVLRTLSILPSLKKKYPNSYITWITRKNALPLFKNLDLVDRVIDYEDPLSITLLHTTKFDIVINVDTNDSAIALASFAKTKEKIGFYLKKSGCIAFANDEARKWFLMGINDKYKKINKKTYQKIISDIIGLDYKNSYIPLELSKDEKAYSEIFKRQNKIKKNGLVVGLNLGAGRRWQNKTWSLKYFEQLTRNLLKRSAQIVLLGGIEEEDKINNLKKKFRRRIISCGYNNSLRNFFSILNVCDIIVTGDTMAAHASLALKKKVIVLLGPTSDSEFEIYNQGIKLFADINCLVCYKNTCDIKPNCMDLIKPKQIENAIYSLYNR